MKEWKTNLHLKHTQGNTTSKNPKLNCGIFQGGSLSSFPFCLSLVSLSYKLNETRYGYYIYELWINHLFLMNNLKVYGKNDKELEGLLTTVKISSNDIEMEIGLHKCSKATSTGRSLTLTSDMKLDESTSSENLTKEKVTNI